MDISDIIDKYNPNNLTVATLGSHSALDICAGAKRQGLTSLVVAERGRERTYTEYFRSRGGRGIVDDVILVEKFRNLLQETPQEELRKRHAIFVPHRSFLVYLNSDYNAIENSFAVPVFGNRFLLHLEERSAQHAFLDKAGIPSPKVFAAPEDIDRTVLVKVAERERPYERAFFLVSSTKEFYIRAEQYLGAQRITEGGLKNAVIEEFVLGAQANFHFFYSPLEDRLELLGIDTRRQTNLDGLLRLPGDFQHDILKKYPLSYEEAGHAAVTVLESMLEEVFLLGDKFVTASREIHPRGIIGPFTLQGAITPGPPKKGITIFDIAPRIGGAPGIKSTPYSEYLLGRPVSLGERVAMEIVRAKQTNTLATIVS
ncbi:MAG: DUF1297 domain-containing protein [Parcubacteria group bacterium]|nr:DUF1297 domain-containing protein [Parcubacteria group bacterium]